MVLVEWEDVKVLDSETWVENKPIADTKPFVVFTVGFLLHSDSQRLVLVESWNTDLTGPRQQIPRGMVRRVSKLRRQ
jgi:hypothetical protein